VRNIGDLPELQQPLESAKPELDLASQLIDKMTTDHFVMANYKDTFAEKLKEQIKQKGEPEKIPEIERPKETPEENLIEALKASINT
jgi:non-homologous end joining protein Ku